MKHFLLLLAILGISNATLRAQYTEYPDRIYGDTLHAPFYHGVTSGDPTPDAVLLWTRITPDDTNPVSLSGTWQLASDTAFTQIIDSGTWTADASRDWTVHTEATGLQPNTFYYYRFADANGNLSMRGRTRTLPVGDIGELKLAIASCASIYSGYFNAYARIAERTDLNAMIHLGDYIYDFVDEDEKVRVPVPFPIDPENLADWRNRHGYYNLDPDQRAARAMHPWIVIWDNHDVQDGNSPQGTADGVQAFLEWVPTRLQDPSEPFENWRHFRFGNLADIYMLNTILFRSRESGGVADSTKTALGLKQRAWLLGSLDTSSTRWHLYGNEYMMNGWRVAPNPFAGDAQGYLDRSSWDGNTYERELIFNHWQDRGINNNIVLSGDAHVSIAADLSSYPWDSNIYDPATGDGSVGVEFLPSSISRGNFDEGYPASLVGVVANVSRTGNPQHLYSEFTHHGYGLLTVTPDSAVAEFWYSDILEQTDRERLGARIAVYDGENRWRRGSLRQPTSLNAIQQLEFFLSAPYPNPAKTVAQVDIQSPLSGQAAVQLLDATGRVLQTELHDLQANTKQTLALPTDELPSGMYLLRVQMGEWQRARLLKVQH
jgi:alkaline phosphatase D